MRALLIAMLWWLASAATAQPDRWTLQPTEQEAIGIVEVRVGSRGPGFDALPAERGTGTIISRHGHVLTASHLFTSDQFAICSGSSQADPNLACRVDFLFKGDPKRRMKLEIVSERLQDRDYIVLRLPSPDRADRANWPFATLARSSTAGEAIYAVGYRGSDPSQPGGSTTIETARGSLRADPASSCGNSYGLARNAGLTTSPGFSGGPVFNQQHRLMGILLGEGCPADGGAADNRDAPMARVLLVQDMPRLCQGPVAICFFGFDGDIERPRTGSAVLWQQRLLGGASVADRYGYTVKIRVIGRTADPLSLCGLMAMDPVLTQTVQADATAGGQLAAVFDAIWALCKPGANRIDSLPSVERLERLAEAEYEPALHLTALISLYEVMPRLTARQSPSDPLPLTQVERDRLAEAEARLRTAAARGWSASAFVLFDQCRMRVFACRESEAGSFLDAAVADGQRDALRSAALLLLAGNTSDVLRRVGIARPEDWDRARLLLLQAATPEIGATTNPQYQLYDNVSAGYLAYFYWGGTYNDRSVVPVDLDRAAGFGQGCNAMGLSNPFFFQFCGMIDAVGRFNSRDARFPRQLAWAFIRGYTGWPAQLAGPLAKNIATWSEDGNDIDRIECPLSEFLTYEPPNRPAAFEARVAYCYFAKP